MSSIAVRSLRPVIALALLVAALAPQPAAASDGVTLTGTVSIQSSRSGRIRVNVPSDATIDVGRQSVTGGGAFAGFLLSEPKSRSGFFAEVLRYPEALTFKAMAWERGQKAVQDREEAELTDTMPPTWSCNVCHIPPGAYDLYVIQAGSPVTITLTLGGLPGSRALSTSDLSLVHTEVWDNHRWSETSELPVLPFGVSYQGCCIGASQGGIAYAQFATRVVTETTSVTQHDFCIRTRHTKDCDLGPSSHTIVGHASAPTTQVSFPTHVLPGGDHEVTSKIQVSPGTTATGSLVENIFYLGW